MQGNNQKRIRVSIVAQTPQYGCSEPTLRPSPLCSKPTLRILLNSPSVPSPTPLFQEAHFFSQPALLSQVPIPNSATQIHLSRSPTASAEFSPVTSYSNSQEHLTFRPSTSQEHRPKYVGTRPIKVRTSPNCISIQRSIVRLHGRIRKAAKRSRYPDGGLFSRLLPRG